MPRFIFSSEGDSSTPVMLQKLVSEFSRAVKCASLRFAKGVNSMSTKIAGIWLVFVVTVAVMVGGCAWRQDVDTLRVRVYALEQSTDRLTREIEKEQTRYEEDIEDSRTSQASLRTLMHDVRDEIVQLRGDLEQTQYELQKTAAAQQGKVADLNRLEKAVQSSLDRVVRIEEYLGLEPSEKLAPLETGEEESIAAEGEEIRETPEELYRRAKELFDQGEYENARELFRSFVNQFPKSKLADNGQFWIGEIYYREKWYEKAILEYQKVIENYPNGNKTASALLKQGFAFLNLNDKANARLILKELIRKFPDSNEAGVAKNKLAALE